MSETSDTGSDAVEISDIEADFATGVGLDTCEHYHKVDDDTDNWEDNGDDDKKAKTMMTTTREQ